MNKDEVKTLFKYARESIKSRFDSTEFKPAKVPESLKEKMGVFVTLTINDDLRGCIGMVEPVTLWSGVIDAARSSAFSDPRFMPLSEEEFKEVVIEISLLTVPKKTTLKAIKEGDGVIISQGLRKALFLPQVWEQLPNFDEFMSQLCMKAGLRSDCYNDSKTAFEKFSVEAWKEIKPCGDIKRV